MQRLLLGIETSHDLGGVALVRGRECLVETSSTGKLKHSEELLILINTALGSSHLALEDVDGIAVSIGPGSFTGLRVGLAAAKGLCLSRAKPLIGVPTLDALASMVRDEEVPVHTIIDAKRGEVYWASYELRDGVQRRIGGYEALSPQGFAERLTSEALVVGSGIERYRDTILQSARVPVRLKDPNPQFPSPTAVAILGLERLESDNVDDVSIIEPIYIRPSDAEAKRRQT
jgi:tRNA threonylcarbamoyladenosine biosynthesis protein TsaB